LQAALIELLGVENKQITDAIGRFCIQGLRRNETKLPSLPFPSDLEMMLENVLPWLLVRDTEIVGFSDETIQCYRSIVSAALAGLPSDRRWKIPAVNGLLHPIGDALCQS
jgi:hypothetical protein